MDSAAYVLIVLFVSITQQGNQPPKYAVAMQEFSSATTCRKALEVIQSKDKSLHGQCIKK